MNEFLKRSVTGTAYVAVITAGIIIHPIVFAVVFITLQFLCHAELYRLLEKAGYSPQKTVGMTMGTLLFLTAFGVSYGLLPRQSFLVFILFFILIFLFEVLRSSKNTLKNSALTLFGLVYVAVPFSLMNFIVFPGTSGRSPFVPSVLMGVFLIVWVYDSVAYLVGSQFGKHKLNPEISPGKSWEGVIGGAVFAIITGILNAVIFQFPGMLNWMVISLLTILFGTFGDLFESKIKRDLNVKDSGTGLPGHGGLLDRVDSLLFALPAVYMWLILGVNFG